MAAYQNLSEQALMEFLQQGDQDALQEIFNRYWSKLYSAANKILDDEQACQDIVQEIFIKLWERRQKLEVRHLGAYLATALKFQVASHFRHHAFEQKHLAVLHYIVAQQQDATAEDTWEKSEMVSRLMDQLPTRCREIFYLSRMEQLSNSEIASRLNISIRTVETQISKALKQMRLRLQDPSAEIITILVCLAWEQANRY